MGMYIICNSEHCQKLEVVSRFYFVTIIIFISILSVCVCRDLECEGQKLESK